MKYRSWDTTQGLERLAHRTLYKSMGYDDKDLEKPIIGIANAWSTIVPGHYNLRTVSEFVRKGIKSADGMPVEFGVIGACTGIADGHGGARYLLPTRELIANSIETMAQAHRLDGLVLLGSCGKVIPGMLMAAVRLDIPAILVNGGPALGGSLYEGKTSDISTLNEALVHHRHGDISDADLLALEDQVMPTCGSCAWLGPANSMACIAEALGMVLPGTGVIPAEHWARKKAAFQSGTQIVELVNSGLSARKIIGPAALQNAIRLSSAIGGSANAAIHIPAIAYEANIDFSVGLMDELSAQVPLLVDLSLKGPANVPDFFEAGGVPAVMKEIEPLLEKKALTVTGKTVGENLSHVLKNQSGGLIHSLDDPYTKSGGLAILYGSLSPEGAVAKPGDINPSLWRFEGPAKVFEAEDAACEAITDKKIDAGDVLVIRYQGPMGGPGMPQMSKIGTCLRDAGLDSSVAIISDGRFSGVNSGCFVGHISPEAAEGGALAVVRNGDQIAIDIPKRKIVLKLPQSEIKTRQSKWRRPPITVKNGYLKMYAKTVRSAAHGAVIPHRD